MTLTATAHEVNELAEQMLGSIPHLTETLTIADELVPGDMMLVTGPTGATVLFVVTHVKARISGDAEIRGTYGQGGKEHRGMFTVPGEHVFTLLVLPEDEK